MVGVTAAGRETALTIQREAAQLFAARGYEATSLREIAQAVGIKVGSLYNHIDSKEQLLQRIMGDTMQDLLRAANQAIEPATDPRDRLARFLECHVRFHAERATEVFIGNAELRSLGGDARRVITERRKTYREMIEDLVVDVTAGSPREKALNPKLHAFSIVAIGTHVAAWYRPGGGLDLDEIVSTYVSLVLRSIES